MQDLNNKVAVVTGGASGIGRSLVKELLAAGAKVVIGDVEPSALDRVMEEFDGAGDLCIRCHSAGGWYGGRSTPTDGSGLQASDDDGIDDGDETGNDATLNPGDTDPLDADSDDDGLSDGAETIGGDGLSNSGDETDPLNPDSDGDGLTDGLESGVTAPVGSGASDGNGTVFSGTDTGSPNYVVDADPASTTDPTDPDTDNDGLQDGVDVVFSHERLRAGNAAAPFPGGDRLGSRGNDRGNAEGQYQ